REAERLRQLDGKLEQVEAADGSARLPGAADVEDEAAVVLEDAVDLAGEGQEPSLVLLHRGVAVLLLLQREGRRGEDEVDAPVGQRLQDDLGVQAERRPERGAVRRVEPLEVQAIGPGQVRMKRILQGHAHSPPSPTGSLHGTSWRWRSILP